MEHFRHRSTEPEAIVHITIPTAAARKADRNGYPLVLRSFRLRLIRVALSSGQTESLATSLLDSKRYPAQEFAALHHCRWRIEEAFKTLKCRLAIEHFSGELPDSIPCARISSPKSGSPMSPPPLPILLVNPCPGTSSLRSCPISPTPSPPCAPSCPGSWLHPQQPRCLFLR